MLDEEHITKEGYKIVRHLMYVSVASELCLHRVCNRAECVGKLPVYKQYLVCTKHRHTKETQSHKGCL